jgi:amidase
MKPAYTKTQTEALNLSNLRPNHAPDIHSCGLNRRAFLGRGMTAGAALLAAPWCTVARRDDSQGNNQQDEGAPWFEATIPQLQQLMEDDALSSQQLTLAYLHRIQRLNPILNAVIETNPDALAIADRRDYERSQGLIRGPLHGIPLLLKDNIATADRMQTTAGSLALVGSRVPADATLTARLRRAGAVILGKANLSEWANFRGNAPCPSTWTCLNGWSARGGFTQNPYVLNWTTCGSSSGSAVGAAVNLCAAAVGTETDGSITCPSANNLIVGLKPSVGLISQDGIIPIGHSQDTAGPMARTVTDVAILLGALQSPFGPAAGASLPRDYTRFLRRGALRGARIGVDRKYFTLDYGGEPVFDAVAEQALAAMRDLGAIIIDPVDSGDPLLFSNAEFTVLLDEFKVQIAAYLAGLTNTSMHTLADLIAFDSANCLQEMKYYGQEVFEASQATSGDLTDPDYLAARQLCIQLARHEGIDAAIQRDQLDAIITPTWSFGTSTAAVAGYPNISVPVAIATDGRPAGIWMFSGFLQEPKLLALAYDLEQEIRPRVQPRFPGTPPNWPDAGICGTAPRARSMAEILSNRPLRPSW